MNTIDQFMALSKETRDAFHNHAYKSDEYFNGFEVFKDKIPAAAADSPAAVEILLDGGTATIVREVGDRGAAGGGYTEVEVVEFPDRDFSRHTSGKNGGEYTADNVTLEDASINRSRGAENMTEAEISAAETSLEVDAELLSNAEILTPADSIASTAAEASADVADVAWQSAPIPEAGGSILGDVGEAVVDGILPAVFAVKAGTYVADQCKSDADKIGYGLAAAGTAAWVATTPVGWAIGAAWATYSIGKLAFKLADKYA